MCKYQDLVYWITYDCNTREADKFFRKTQGGMIYLQRPIVIPQYNKYMGCVELLDIQQLHYNEMDMRLNWRRLKFFFYLIDVGNENDLVLHRL